MKTNTEIANESKEFEQLMFEFIDFPLAFDIERFQVSATLCHISFEHWASVKLLLESSLFPSGVTILRSQYESLVRSIWALNLATNEMISKLIAGLDKETEQHAKNIPGVNDMMNAIEKGMSTNISKPLSEIKIYSWNAMNSFTHSGVHAISRYRNGFPDNLIEMCYQQSNGIALLTGMQYAILCGKQDLQKELISLSLRYRKIMPKVIS